MRTYSQNSTTASVCAVCTAAVPLEVTLLKVEHISVFHQLPQVAHGSGDWGGAMSDGEG